MPLSGATPRGLRRSPWQLPILMAAATFVSAALCAASGIRHYVNVRFGFSVDVPSELTADPPPDNGDGQAFHAPDGSLRVTVSGVSNALDESLRAFVARDRADCAHRPPDYLVERPDRVVFSCVSGGDILYQKTIRRGRGMDAALVSLRMRYPASEKVRWQAAVTTASRTLRLLPTGARDD